MNITTSCWFTRPSLRRNPKRCQFVRQRVGPLGDVAGAEADYVVAWAGDVPDQTSQLLRAVEAQHMAVATRPYAGDQAVAVGARNRRLAGWIDRGDDHAVGIVETGAEWFEQRMQAGVAMGLHHGD